MLLTIAMLLCCIAVSAQRFEVDGIYYSILSTEDKTIKVSGHNNETCQDCVSIPETIENNGVVYTVTSIGDEAFLECEYLSSITIPSSVRVIGNYAFDYCPKLTSVTIPNSVTSIGNRAFYSCTALKDVYCHAENVPSTDATVFNSSNYSNATLHVPAGSLESYKTTSPWSGFENIVAFSPFSGVVEIDGINYELNGESKQATVIAKSSGKYSGEIVFLESVEYEGTTYRVTSIGNSAFSGCYDLTSVSIGNNVTSIGDYAFASCNALSSVTIGNSVTSIGEGAFSSCSGLSSVTIPNSVTSIGACAFEYCSGLPSVTIPNSVTSIGNSAFYYCSGLTSVTIGNSVKNIGNYVFAYCSGLTSVTIPNNVTSIGVEAFRNCTSLTSVTIPNSVTSIRDRAFYYCSRLTSVTIPNSVTSIGNSVFYYCSNLTSITIPNSVTSIGQDAFRSCSGLTSIAIPNSVKSIGNSAFLDCAGLTSVAIGSGVNDIGDKAFAKCSKLLDVYCYAEKVSTIKVNAFDSSNPENATLHVPSASVESYKKTEPWSGFSNIVAISTEIDGINYDFNAETKQATVIYKTTMYSGKIVIPESVEFMGVAYSVTSIAGGAFSFGYGMTSVTIPNSVKSIGGNAFGGLMCTVSSVHISDIAAWCNIEFGDINSNPLNKAHHLYLNGEEVKDLVIPNSVTSIGDYAFSGCSGLTSVTIPNSVTNIGGNAFSGCSGLTSVTIPNSVTSIGGNAFSGCSGLTSVHISDIVAWCNIDFLDNTSNPLYNAHHLYLDGEEVKDLVIPNSVTSIGDNAFSGCSGLTSVTIPNSVTNIGDNAFSGCSGLTSVTIGNSVESIGDNVFEGCSSLTSVTIPNSVTSIGDYAFSGCSSLTSVTIPNSVKSIGGNAFSDCSGLTSVHISDIVAWCNIDFLDNTSNPLYNAHHLYLDGEEVKDLVIPNSVTSIGDNAFAGCSGLTSITMGFDIKNIGTNAFVKCSGLLDVYCYAIKLPSTESDAFDGSNPEKVTLHVPSAYVKSYTQTEPWSGFGNIVALSTEIDGVNYDFNAETKQATVIAKSSGKYSGEIVIPESVEYGGTTYSVTSIGDNAFSGCSGLTSVTIGNSVTSIRDYTFCNCSGLTSVTIGNSVTSIGEKAFWYCSRLTSVTIGNSVTSIGEGAFEDCSVLTSVTIPNSVKSIGNRAFQYCFGLTSVTIGNSVTSIGESTFLGCSGMTSVTIPNSVTSIGNSAFQNCSGLPSVTIPNSVTSIGNIAFGGCSRLTSITIPNSVTSIGEGAFQDCSSLTSVTIPNSVTSIGLAAFSCCSSLTSVTIPNSVTNIGREAFYDCTGLTSVTIPNSVTSIGGCAFYECSGLTSVTIGNSVTSIGEDAFAYCPKLLSVYCYAENVPSTESDAFQSSYPENATLHVPAASIESYKATEPWSDFGTITPLQNLTLTDGEKFENNTEQRFSTLTYTRTLPNMLWNPLYVPFEIPVSEIIDKYEVAYVNNVNSYDHNDDGTIDDMRMEVIKIKSGTLNANYPYLIKARNEEAKNMTITLENTTLFQSVETTIDCSSVFAKHEITGIYNKRYKNELPEGAMAISMAGAWQPIASGSYLNPFRLYMTITARDGSPVKVEPAAMSRIRISVLGEDDMETEIENVKTENEERKTVIFDLSGRRVQNPTKGGVYLVNGKKVIF